VAAKILLTKRRNGQQLGTSRGFSLPVGQPGRPWFTQY